MNPSLSDFKDILRSELSQRLSNNAQYSLRAFARDLGFSAAQMSHVLSGRSGLSGKSAAAICAKLGWSRDESEYFCTLVMATHARSKAAQRGALEKLATFKRKAANDPARTIELQLDLFRVISDWYHFPLLELIKMDKSFTEKQLSRKIGIQELEIKNALQRLLRLELISKTKTGYQVEQDTVYAKEGIPSEAIRKFHAQILEKARVSLNEQSVSERYFRSEVLPFPISHMAEAQKEIKDFFESFSARHSNGKSAEAVYCLSTQFFRMTQKENS